MTSDPALVRTIDKILDRTRKEILSGFQTSLQESHGTLDGSIPRLEQEYERIVSDGRKEADKLEKQLVGSADLEARNRRLILVEGAVERVFGEAVKQIQAIKRGAPYARMMSEALKGATDALRTTEVTVYVNAKDKRIMKKILGKENGASLAPESIECMGGMIIRSRDGVMTFDDTIDTRLERMKPLIRKKIATKFGIGE